MKGAGISTLMLFPWLRMLLKKKKKKEKSFLEGFSTLNGSNFSDNHTFQYNLQDILIVSLTYT